MASSPSASNVSPDSSTGGRSYLVDVARGLGCLAVLLFHSLIATPPEALPGIRAVTEHGWLGVYIFFPLSGWCIAESISRARARGDAPLGFLRDRGWRIYPTYWAAIALLVLLRLAASPFNHTSLPANLPHGLTGWVGTLLLIDPYLGLQPYLIVSWSLVFELGFYLLASLTLLPLVRLHVKGPLLLVTGGVLCALPWVFKLSGSPWFVLELWTEFFVGVVAWYAAHRRTSWGLAFLSLLALVNMCWPVTPLTGRITALVTATLLFALAPLDRTLSRWRVLQPLFWVGTFSYSLYLIHVPLIAPWTNLGGRYFTPTSPAFSLVWLSALVLALAGGWLLHRTVERPLLRWRKR